MSLEESLNTSNETTATPFKYPSPVDAYRAAKRRIVNNALRRQQASLDLSNFGLLDLPKEIGQLKSLRRLNISNNRISQLPHEIGDLPDLRMLDARSNKLISIPDSIGALRNLRILNLDKNKIRELPASIAHLARLVQLSVDDNDLETLPREIGELIELTDLSLDNNKLSSLPRQISGLLKLTGLYLNQNRFSEFPSAALELRRLKILMMGNNEISAIPAAIAKLTNLEDLFLLGNLIDMVPPEVATLKLRGLNLATNRLKSLPNVLGTVSSLEVGARRVPKYDGLCLEDNDFPDPYPTLIAPGQPKATENVLSWLRGELNPASLESDHGIAPEVKPVSPPEPSEEAGPTFHVADGRVDLIVGPERTTNFDLEIQQTLHERLRRRVQLLHEATTKVSNQHPQLLTVVDEYVKLVRPEIAELDIVDLWAAGNALMAQAHSFQHQDRTLTLSEPLEPSHLGVLTEVAALHGGFILGFPTAVRLSDRADQARIGPVDL
jgi:Leucine-rich repeat (LRR) protein